MLLSGIGVGSNALYCLTDREQCCSTAAGRSRGLWRVPGVPNIPENNGSIYVSRHLSSLSLNIRSGGPTGVYMCLIPDAGNVLRTLSINVQNSKFNNAISNRVIRIT